MSRESSFTMYSTPWCGYCHRLKAQLEREGIAFEVVDIEQDPEAGTLVLPGGVSISRSLVEHWYGGPLPGQW